MERLQKLLEMAAEEHGKFKAGNKSAGTRARKHLQEIRTEAQDIRKAIQAEKNGDA